MIENTVLFPRLALVWNASLIFKATHVPWGMVVGLAKRSRIPTTGAREKPRYFSTKHNDAKTAKIFRKIANNTRPIFPHFFFKFKEIFKSDRFYEKNGLDMIFNIQSISLQPFHFFLKNFDHIQKNCAVLFHLGLTFIVHF